VIGGFIGASLVLQLYHPVIDAYNAAHGLTRATGGAAGVFFTHPGEHITPIHAFWDEVILTGLLLLGSSPSRTSSTMLRHGRIRALS
jgi:glycerol uptake facilitator protein